MKRTRNRPKQIENARHKGAVKHLTVDNQIPKEANKFWEGWIALTTEPFRERR